MSQVDGRDPEVRRSAHINLIPCAVPDETNLNIAHTYEIMVMANGEIVQTLGWLSLEGVRLLFESVPYTVGRASHGLCPEHIQEERFGHTDT